MFKKHWILLLPLFIGAQAQAFKDGNLYVGVGYYSQNVFNKVVDSDSGSKGFLGAPSYPLFLKKDWSFSGGWFFSPYVSYTLIPRSSADDSARNTLTHINASFGQNFGGDWDWSVGSGYLRQEIKGSGGSKQLSNGTGTSTFAVPGRTVAVNSITVSGGVGYTFSNGRVAGDLIFENFLSSNKRSQNLMISYGYMFGGF